MSFEEYLQEQKLATSTIRGHIKDFERFKKWIFSENINYEAISYNELLGFIQQAAARGVSKQSINKHLHSICKYYDYLITKGVFSKNPARYLRVKKEGKKVLKNVLTTEELEKIYLKYANKPTWSFREKKHQQIHQRNSLILSLLIYQGIQSGELKKIESVHINLGAGTIYIPSTSRSNSRTLKLSAEQILPIQQYLFSLKGTGKLFTANLCNIMSWLMRELRKESHLITSAVQIRSSVIVNWLKQHNLRQVQYMAGHRYISSTERYKQEDLGDLQRQLDLFHPMG